MNCAVSGCTKAAKRYGRYCNTHGTRDRRHGHPRQETVRTKDLRPYRDIVRRRMQRNPDAAAWQTLETIWRQTVRRCQARLREYLGGKPVNRWERLAFQGQVHNLAADVVRDPVPHPPGTAGTILETGLAKGPVAIVPSVKRRCRNAELIQGAADRQVERSTRRMISSFSDAGYLMRCLPHPRSCFFSAAGSPASVRPAPP